LLIDHPIQRRSVLAAKGKTPELINRLLEDAEKWIQFRTILRDQVDAAKEFRAKYSSRYDEDKALDNLESTIDNFKEDISDKITELDKLSQSLIQIVSILTIHNVSQRHIIYQS
jgi:predicted RNase H-like HicB family nuclease